jgi:(p)ppGpp synthase/HD superfamily hydrolase
MITLQEASALARTAHAGQQDLAGNPYHLHVFAVRDLLAPHGTDAQIAGVLHDILEDTETTSGDLRAAGVPEHVVEAVESVTKWPGEPYEELIARAAAHPIGRLVKLADNAHNSDETRLALLREERAAALREKYARARAVLNGETS